MLNLHFLDQLDGKIEPTNNDLTQSRFTFVLTSVLKECVYQIFPSVLQNLKFYYLTATSYVVKIIFGMNNFKGNYGKFLNFYSGEFVTYKSKGGSGAIVFYFKLMNGLIIKLDATIYSFF